MSYSGLGTTVTEGGWGYTDTPIGRCVEAGGLWNEEAQYCMPAPTLTAGSSAASNVGFAVAIAAGALLGYLFLWPKSKK